MATPRIALAVEPDTLSIVQATSREVAVMVTRTNFARPVALGLEGAPTGVTGSFEPTALTDGATASTLTLSAAAGAPTGEAGLTIRAEGEGVERGEAALSITVAPAAPASAWSALGAGMSGGVSGNSVYAMAVYDDGTGPALYAAGRFTIAIAGGQAANRIARWDGSEWSPSAPGSPSD